MTDAFDYAGMQADAVELIAEFGQAGWLRQMIATGSAPYNPDRRTQTDYDATFVVTDYTTSEIDGERVLATDLKALVSPGITVEPTQAMKVVMADQTELSIVNVQRVAPGGVTMLWQLQLRR